MNALQAAHEAHKARRARMEAAAFRPPLPALPMIVKPAAVDDVVAKSLAVYADDLHAALNVISIRRKAVREPATIQEIINEVVAVCGVTRADIMSHRRIERVVIARQFIMWRARNETTLSFQAIGKAFGGRDHTTTRHACIKTEERIAAGEIPQSWLDTVRGFGNG